MIRYMTELDIIKIVELEKKVFNESLGEEFLYNELKLNPYQKYFVYELNNILIGYIGLRVYDDKAEVLNFLINEDYQNKGYGKELFNFVINFLKDSNINELTLEVNVLNKKALSFYKKFNFEIVTKKKNYYKNNVDAYLLKRDV